MMPISILSLWQLADAEGIAVEWYPDESFPRGRYCYVDGQSVIFLNPALEQSSMRYRCTFAHELGHYYAGVGRHFGDDERAMAWARQLVLPTWWILPRRHLEPWRIAEEADVYQEWVEARLKGLRNCLHGGYAV